MPTWTFWDYADSNGKSQIQAWLDAKRENEREGFRAKLLARLLQANAVGKLDYPQF